MDFQPINITEQGLNNRSGFAQRPSEEESVEVEEDREN